MKHCALGLLATLILAAGLGSTAFGQDQSPLQRELMIIDELFPGTYDNMEQVYFDRRLNLPAAQRHQRVRSEVRRIPGNRFGEHAFFILDYWYEQDRWHPRIYSFHMDEAEGAIRMKLHAFSGFDRTSYLQAHEDLSLLDSLSLEQLSNLPECDMFWRRTVGGFHAEMKPKACVYEEGGERVYADYQIMLNDEALWKGDVIRRLADDVQVNSEPVVLHQQNRAQFFTCSMTFDEDGEITMEWFGYGRDSVTVYVAINRILALRSPEGCALEDIEELYLESAAQLADLVDWLESRKRTAT